MIKDRLVSLFAVVCMAICLAGCENDANDPRNVETNSNSAEARAAGVVCYGNGVYYFPCYGANFGNTLSKFIKDNPELQFVDATGDGTAVHGFDKGYFVVFREK